MSNIVLGNAQIADLHATLQECINNTTSSECSDEFHSSVFDSIAPRLFFRDYNILEVRTERLTDFVRDGLRWNERSYNLRYGCNHHRSLNEVDVIMKSGKVTSMEQAALTLKALVYNSDYSSQTGCDDKLMELYARWEEQARDMLSKMAEWFMERDYNKAKAQWIY